jgi:hypothetical protein
MKSDKRQFNRINFDAAATLYDANNEWLSTLIDISLKGALVVKPDNWNPGQNEHFRLLIQLNNCDAEIRMNVELSHTQEKRLGFKCDQIDLDSITVLRRLIELNLGEQGLLDREIENMLPH